MTYTLLMTACINPKNLDRNNFRDDPHIRLSDYKVALTYWLSYNESKITSILFVENSGYELKELRAIAETKNIYKRKIEFLQFDEAKRLPGVHYGYSEMEIIDYAFDNSVVIKDACYVIKTTGRLYFPSLNKLLAFQEKKKFDFIADSRDYKIGKKEKHYVVTTVFVVKPSFYKQYLYDVKLQLQKGIVSHMETLYFKILKPLIKQNVSLRFPFYLKTEGVGAHWNVNYSSSSKRFEFILRSLIRQLLPFFKI